MRITKIFLLLSCFFIAVNAGFSQEKLVPMYSNPAIINHLKQQPNSFCPSKTSDTLELPFLDDFSNGSVYPDDTKWVNNLTFINQTLALNPPTIGVATFDAIDAQGAVYERAVGQNFIADSLTSKPINLSAPHNDGIYLSFVYQGGGNVDAPETNDSLILEFLSPTTGWHRVWTTEGTYNENFISVIVSVETEFLYKGFQFRFLNIASLNDDFVSGRIGNTDFWHIDYVYLDENRTEADIVIDDVAFTKPMSSWLSDYESMPYTHYQSTTTAMKNSISVAIKNNFNDGRYINMLHFTIVDEWGGNPDVPFDNDVYNLSAQQEMSIPFPANGSIGQYYSFPDYQPSASDSALFRITSNFTLSETDPTFNNEIIYEQKFYNYYAYDDGTAENGYGLSGEGTRNAMLAYKFINKKEDTLRAVQFYFNRTLNNANQKYFYLAVWADNNGEPGDTIYRRTGIRPEFSGAEGFDTYDITDTLLVLPEGDYYVGWMQTTEDFLNLGFDLNRDMNSHIFYNIDGVWKQSSVHGALMIRPVFGAEFAPPPTNITPVVASASEINLYPNPTNGIINFGFAEMDNIIEIQVFDMTGRKHKIISSPTSKINVSDLANGMYFIRFCLKNGSVSTKKIVVRK